MLQNAMQVNISELYSTLQTHEQVAQLLRASVLAKKVIEIKLKSRQEMLEEMQETNDREFKYIFTFGLFNHLKHEFQQAQNLHAKFEVMEWGFKMFTAVDDGSCLKEGIRFLMVVNFGRNITGCCLWHWLERNYESDLISKLHALYDTEDVTGIMCNDCQHAEEADNVDDLSEEDDRY